MTRPLRIVYEERPSELFRKGELHKPELEALVQDLLVTIGATGVAFAQRQSDPSKALVCVVSVGRSAPLPGAQVDPERGISGRCVREGRTQKSYDTRIDPRVDDSICQQLAIRSLAAVPLMHGSGCVGLLEAFSDRPGHFDAEKVQGIELTVLKIGKLLGFEAERSARDNNPELMPSPADLNSMNTPEPSVAHFEQREPRSIAKPESLPPGTDQLEPTARSRPPAAWVIAALVLLAVVLIVSWQHRQPPPPRTAGQRLPSSAPSPIPSSAPPATATPNRVSNTASSSSATPKLTLAERAARSDVPAQLALASAYQKGNGVPRDLVRAITWYILAGANGNAGAKRRSVQLTRSVTSFEIGQIRYNVGRMYVEGIGVKRDYVSAYAWFELAKAQGEIRAQGEENKLQSLMTAGQIQKAKSRAAQWLKLHRQKARAAGNGLDANKPGL